MVFSDNSVRFCVLLQAKRSGSLHIARVGSTMHTVRLAAFIHSTARWHEDLPVAGTFTPVYRGEGSLPNRGVGLRIAPTPPAGTLGKGRRRCDPLCKLFSYGTLVVGVSSGGLWALHHCETASKSPHRHIEEMRRKTGRVSRMIANCSFLSVSLIFVIDCLSSCILRYTLR